SGETLTATEMLTLARCYHWVGKQQFAVRLYKELLCREEVQSDPNTLSLVYTRLAAVHANSTKQRTQFLDLALRCLPDDACYVARHAAVCSRLIRMGELTRARDVMAKIERYVVSDRQDLAVLDVTRASLLTNYGDFVGAAEYYLRCSGEGARKVALLINLGF